MDGLQQQTASGQGGVSAYGPQLMPQGLFGGLLGGPLGGLVGKGIGGLFGNPGLGSQIGQVAGGIGGSLLPFGADPVMAAYMQQQGQLAPQGIFSNLLGRPLSGYISDGGGSPWSSPPIIGMDHVKRNLLPFNVDPVTAAYIQQQGQLAPQGWLGNLVGQIAQPVGSAIGGMLGNQGLGSTIGGVAGQLGRMLPFNVDPLTAAYMQQQGQLAPQGWLGNLVGQIAQPVGSAIGGMLGNQGLGSTIGGVAGQLGRMLPFNVDPLTAAYMQQAAMQSPQNAGYQGYSGSMGGGYGAQPTIH